MPRKYIIVKQLYAKTPFTHCHLHFIIKKAAYRQIEHTSIPFLEKSISASPREILEFEFQAGSCDDLGVFVLAVSRDNRVANIGHVALDVGQNVWEKKEYLRGIHEQNGFLIFSTKDGPFADNGREVSSSIISSDEKGLAVGKEKEGGRIRKQIRKDEYPHADQLQESERGNNMKSKSQPIIEPLTDHVQSNKLVPLEELSSIWLQTQSTPQLTPISSDKTHPLLDSSLSDSEKNHIFEQASEVLQKHKLKNSEHRELLQQLQRMQEEQRDKLKELGMSSN